MATLPLDLPSDCGNGLVDHPPHAPDILVGGRATASTSTVKSLYSVCRNPKLNPRTIPFIQYEQVGSFTDVDLFSFISDIGAFHLKPVFIAGCTITALTFMGTIFSVHYVRYSSHTYALQDSRWRKAVSVVAVVSGLVACGALLLLTIYDTYKFHEVHLKLLLTCFGGLGLSMISTTVVWFDQTWKPSKFERLRRW